MILPSGHPPEPARHTSGHTAAERQIGDTQSGPTVWGLDPLQLHDRFWASRGVQVVRPGEPMNLARKAPFFLLMEPRALAIFDPADAEEVLSMAGSELMYLRIHDSREQIPREHVVTDADNRFVRFERLYDRPRRRLARAALTRHIQIARIWQSATVSREGWQQLRRDLPKDHRSTLEAHGMLYDGFIDIEVASFVRDLTKFWVRPDATIERAIQVAPGVWKDREATIDPTSKLIGSVWIGTGRHAEMGMMVIGPAVLWDDPRARPTVTAVRWEDSPWRNAGPVDLPGGRRMPEPALIESLAEARRIHNFFKRCFDIVFSLFAILFTLPFYPFIIFAIAIEDGWPVFFAHKRETLGGREFPCLKFRSMRRDAEKMKHLIKKRNQADGPQFFMEDDPRLTRVGRIIRKFRLDEFPQFFNVLAGHMSVVGPRPSPFTENQFCPAWREARLSVRPGITGLWQIKRTRAPGTDFQEWIRYDIEYVENARWSLDLLIIWKTIVSVLRGADEHQKEPRA